MGIENALAGTTVRHYERSWLLRSAVEARRKAKRKIRQDIGPRYARTKKSPSHHEEVRLQRSITHANFAERARP
jgi:hypothetical protein